MTVPDRVALSVWAKDECPHHATNRRRNKSATRRHVKALNRDVVKVSMSESSDFQYM
jgi:hypothetical protein